MERELGGCVTGSCLGLGGKKRQRPERFSPAPTPLCRALPASWSLLPRPEEQATPSAQHTPCPFPTSGISPHTSLLQTLSPTGTLSPSPTLFNTHPLDLPFIPPLLITSLSPSSAPSLPTLPPWIPPSITLPPSHPSPPPLGSPTAPVVSHIEQSSWAYGTSSACRGLPHTPRLGSGLQPSSPNFSISSLPAPHRLPLVPPPPHTSPENRACQSPALPTPSNGTLIIRLKSCLSTRRK